MVTPLEQLDPAKAWQPAPKDQWNLKWAAHLYRRAAFGTPPRDIEETTASEALKLAVDRGRDAAIEELLNGAKGQDEDKISESMDFLGRHIAASGGRISSGDRAALGRLQGWWLYRMLYSPHPLRERLTLFWHNHFATSVAKVRSLPLMFNQNRLLRKHALGKFPSFLLEASRDAAMIVWLDNNSNIKGSANENFAREVMELFSLGVGNYTETDIREAARAFTGWSSNGEQFVFNSAQHDFGRKTVLGQSGAWNGEDVIRIVLEQPSAARFLVRKMFRQFINDSLDPPDKLLEPLADQFRSSGYDIRACIATLLRSRIFFSDHAYRQRIKSPVEYVVGLVSSFNGVVSPKDLAETMDGLGQSLFEPPNVAGWKGGKTWLNSATLVARHNLAWRLVGGTDARFKEKIDPARVISKLAKKDGAKQVNDLLDLLLQGDVDPQIRQKLIAHATRKAAAKKPQKEELRKLAHTILLLPEYQLA